MVAQNTPVFLCCTQSCFCSYDNLIVGRNVQMDCTGVTTATTRLVCFVIGSQDIFIIIGCTAIESHVIVMVHHYGWIVCFMVVSQCTIGL